jgi:hypothetical protein
MDLLRRSGVREFTLRTASDPIRPSDDVFMHERLLSGAGYDSFELGSYRAVRDILDADLRRGSTSAASVLGLGVIVSDDGMYENSGALPRFYVAGVGRPASHEQALSALEKHTVARGEALIEQAAHPFGAVPGVAGDVTIDVDRPEHLELRVRAARDGVLVANDSYYPGWHARVDGTPAAILRANAHMRAIPISAGEHVVSMRFEPESFWTGVWISAAAAAGLAVAVATLLIRSRAA